MPVRIAYKRKEGDGDLTLKEKVLYSLLAAAGATGIVVTLFRFGKQMIANTSEARSFETGTPATYAKQIKMALENKYAFGADVNAIRTVIRQIRNKEELEQVKKEYKKQTKGSEMYFDLSEGLKSSEYTELLLIMSGKPGANEVGLSDAQYRAWAMRLYYALISTWGWGLPGTDEDAIKAVFLEIPTQAAYKKVEQAYYSEYGETLSKDLALDLEVWEKDEIMAIIKQKPVT